MGLLRQALAGCQDLPRYLPTYRPTRQKWRPKKRAKKTTLLYPEGRLALMTIRLMGKSSCALLAKKGCQTVRSMVAWMRLSRLITGTLK
jgi:hypothetical protein